ncbi:ketopantoate reductase PanE/ApbA-domain-containing protein [Tuber indicum]|nr:ketopantoate reductase PanE/ApbA-domain-containing protein [Tuber indicum]
MAPAAPRLRILSVGSNPVSAFLSWRLQATHACDVTLVWKSGFDSVSQYGISFKSNKYGNERFKLHSVVRTPEEAATSPAGFDYVILCVKALPDVYDLGSIIESVVTPQNTCIVVNTTSCLGVEAYLESRYPTNIVLSLVAGANINQLGPSEFEHVGNSEIWLGSTSQNASIPMSIQMDMAEALALTLASGQVECHVSTNIRQEQWERMIGPIAFQPLSVLLETPVHSQLMEKTGAKKLISDIIDELMEIAKAQYCSFPQDFKQRTIDTQLQATQQSMFYQDFVARRPMEIESYLGSPIKFAQLVGVRAGCCQSLYTMLHHIQTVAQSKPPVSPPASITQPAPRQMRGPPGPPPGQLPNGAMPNNRRPPPPRGGPGPDHHMGTRRGPPPQFNGPPTNGPHPNGYPRRNASYSPRPPSATPSRRNSMDGEVSLEEFGHIALYGDMVGDEMGNAYAGSIGGGYNGGDIALRERELALRQRELVLREQELGIRQMGKQGRGKSRSRSVYDDDGDDDDLYVEAPPPMPPIDPDNFDMMSVTSRRTRRLPSASNLKGHDAEVTMQPGRARHPMVPHRPGPRSRVSSRLMNDIPSLNEPITSNPLIGYSSDRYGHVDRKMLSDNSRANSMTSQREDLRDIPGLRGGPYPPMASPQQLGRRTPMPPGGPPGAPNGHGPRSGYPQDQRGYRGPSNGHPPNGYGPNGYQQYGPIPNGPVRQPALRYLEGQGLLHQVEQISNGVSQTNPLKGPPSNRDRSTTGSASASASNDSGSSGAEHSASSSSSSLGRRIETMVR